MQGYELLFYGDSLLEPIRDVLYDVHEVRNRTTGVGQAWLSHFASYRDNVLALKRELLFCYVSRALVDEMICQGLSPPLTHLADDQTAQLLWRLQNGELPKTPPAVIVIYIGMFDLKAAKTRGRSAPEIALRIVSLVKYVRERLPMTHVVLPALLPTGPKKGGAFVPDYPNKHSKACEKVNKRIKKFAQTDSAVHFVDCSEPFLVPNDDAHAATPLQINTALLPDNTRLSAEGFDAFGRCIAEAVRPLIGPAGGVTTVGKGGL